MLTWNAARAGPAAGAWKWATSELLPHLALAALTEVRVDALDRWGGHTIAGGDDWGYEHQNPCRRKVALWSHQPWTEVDVVGSTRLPGGRFVAGTTHWRGVPVRVVGVCVPWSAAHVSTGRRDRRRWQDHLAYLEMLPDVLSAQRRPGLPMLVAGDFNQTYADPAGRQPHEARAALSAAFAGLRVVTGGAVGRRPLIDHIALDPDLASSEAVVVIAEHAGRPMSDHDAVWIE